MREEQYIHIDEEGNKIYYADRDMKILHRTDGPAVENTNGYRAWWMHGKLHRTDGPALERVDGTKKWYVNDKLHRTDGPAIEYASGTKEWYVNDKLHRADGPAAERADGANGWWLHGKRYTKEEFTKTLKKKNIVVYNYQCGNTYVFASLDDYKDFAIDSTLNTPGYSAWNDEVYLAEFGKNIFDCEQLDLWAFKNTLS